MQTVWLISMSFPLCSSDRILPCKSKSPWASVLSSHRACCSEGEEQSSSLQNYFLGKPSPTLKITAVKLLDHGCGFLRCGIKMLRHWEEKHKEDGQVVSHLWSWCPVRTAVPSKPPWLLVTTKELQRGPIRVENFGCVVGDSSCKLPPFKTCQ